MTEKPPVHVIRHALAQCYGSEERYSHGFFRNLVYTQGVREMAKLCGAYWLLDLIASYQKQIKQNYPSDLADFQTWELRMNPDIGGATAVCLDGDNQIKITQDIEFTDFPLPEGIKIFAISEGELLVLLLPSEY